MLSVLLLVITSLLSLTEAQNKPISKNARCGSAYRSQTCQGSSFGNCCSNYGYCGSTSDYCAPKNCQKDFGSCNGGQASSVRGTTLSSIIIPANPSTASAVRETVTVTSTLTPSVQSIVTVTLSPSVVPAVTVTLTPSAVSATTVTLTPSAAQTVTVVGSPSLLPASTITIVGSQSLLPASTITVLETPSPLPASTTTVFGSPSLLPASTIVQTITETPSPLAASTVTVIESASPLAASTITVVETPSPLAASTVTVVQSATPLAASTVTVIETPSPLAASTVTVVESASPLPASTITETATISATPLPAVITTSTVTASGAAACPNPTGNAVINGDFESPLVGNWIPLAAGDSTLERTNSASAPGGTFSFRARISAINGNLPQRVVQALNLCPGTAYRVSFQARRTTTVGAISAVAYLSQSSGSIALAGGVVTSTTFTAMPNLGFVVATESTALLIIELVFSGGANAAKEALIDNVVVTQT